jgi:glycosyltransferase involved in cell wall biosynthesis
LNESKEDSMTQPSTRPSYVLITPARNEEQFIANTIESVIHQTVLPLKWVIVNDGSTDSTEAIVSKYAAQHPWIALVNLPTHRDRSFAAKVYAFNAGFEKVKDLPYEVIGNLDSDITFDADYLEFLLDKFASNPRLGVAGTIFREEGYSSGTDSFEGQNHVAGACQLFRRECFAEIGGYKPNKGGGIDWIAVTTARMVGWTTRSYREKWCFHHRHVGTAERSEFAAGVAYGYKDYYMGAHPLWQALRVTYRLTKRPFIIGGVALGYGYLKGIVLRPKSPISKELIQFYRKEQMQKLSVVLRSFLTFKSIDKFKVLPE